MNSNPEQRDKTRFPHETPITLENFEIGLLHGARMLNFSAEGLYFESDYVLERGTELFIGITNSPYADEPDVYECYRAQIRWRKPLKKSSFYYGYGVKFLELQPETPNIRRGRNLRKHPRKSCAVPIKYVTKNQILQGEIRNISLGGIFLKTPHTVPVGQRLSLAIPVRKKGKIIKKTGRIVWADHDGVGIEFQPSEKDK
jgi:Tfp pilus assembly protein PilZ